MKLPATLADLGLAAGVAYALRSRPGWAAAGALAILLHPGTWYISAWWGQFESIYVLPLLGAFLAAVAGRRDLAAVLVAAAVMTKPQALPLAVPFGAWFLATGGLRCAVRAGIVGLLTIVVLWLPFVAADGPARYLANLREYVDGLFPVVSLRAWNPWWALQVASGAEGLVVDSTAVAGPVTFRWLGLGAAAALEIALITWIVRRPSRETLAWALAAAAIGVPMLLTGMHERYTYAGLVFLVLLWPDRRAIGLWVAQGILFAANLVAAVPPAGGPGSLLPVDGIVGLVGSIGMTVVAALVVRGAQRVASPGTAMA